MFTREPISAETWPSIHALLAPAMEKTGERVSSLIDLLLADRNQLWVKREGGDLLAAAVSELEPPETICIRLMGGRDIMAWLDDAIATIAHEAGHVASKVRVEVIPALERPLREQGFRKVRVEMEKAVG